MKSKIVLIAILLGSVAVLWYVGYLVIYYRNAPVESEKKAYLQSPDIVTYYLYQNINSLSPQPATLGGKFYVTKVTFGDHSTGTVSYEDGHNAFVADFAYVFAQDGVKITSFTLKPDSQKATSQAEFMHEGNLKLVGTKPSDSDTPNLYFLYSDENKTMQTVALSISPSTICVSGGNSIACDAISNDQFLKTGDRVKIEGTLASTTVAVDALIKLTPAF